MSPPRLSRVFLWLCLAFLVISALVAIAAVMTGDFGDTRIRILATSGTVSAASICAMACAAFRERARVRGLGDLGIALATLAGLTTVVATWIPGFDARTWKTVFALGCAAVAVAHAELLWLPVLRAGHRWVQVAATALIATLALLIDLLILGGARGDLFTRSMIVVSILVALVTLLVPVLWRIDAATVGTKAAAAERLVLTRQPDGSFADAAGNRYAVRRVDDVGVP